MTYSEEEFADALSKAVAEAVAPIKAEADRKVVDLQSKIDAFESAKADNEVAGQIAEIQLKLDADGNWKVREVSSLLSGVQKP